MADVLTRHSLPLWEDDLALISLEDDGDDDEWEEEDLEEDEWDEDDWDDDEDEWEEEEWEEEEWDEDEEADASIRRPRRLSWD